MPTDDFDLGSAMDTLVTSGEVKINMEEDSHSSSPSPAPAPATESIGEPAAPPAPESAPAPAPEAASDYPKSWKPDYKEKWATLDPDVRSEILRREENFHQGITPYRNLAERFRDALEPVAPLVQQGTDPFQLFKAFGSYHAALSDPNRSVNAFKALMKDYGVSVEDLTAEAPYVHPQVAALQSELEGVKSRLSAADQQALQQRQTALRAQLDTFAAAPENAHFNEVAGQMATLLRADPRLTLKDAYDQACWVNPEVRAKILEKQRADKAAEAAKAAAASAGSVRSNARTAPATGAVGSMDDTMRETLAALKNRGG